MRSLALAAALLSFVAVAPSAQAQEKREWYGWQTLGADGVAITAGAALMSTNALNANGLHMGAAVFGYGGWMLATPIIHAAHGNYLTGLGSLGLRAVLPAVGLYAGCALDKTPSKADQGFACLGGAALGVTIGAATAMVLDAAVFGYTKPKPRGFEVVPTGSIEKHGGTIGLAGVF